MGNILRSPKERFLKETNISLAYAAVSVVDGEFVVRQMSSSFPSSTWSVCFVHCPILECIREVGGKVLRKEVASRRAFGFEVFGDL